MEVPQQLIFIEDGKMKACDETLKTLRQLKAEVVTVGIIGPYRKGKSFFMNRLLGQRRGFKLSSSIHAETAGIWVQAKQTQYLPNCITVALDTQGFFYAKNPDNDADLKVFIITQLLCDCLVYNMQGTISDNLLQFLDMTTEAVKMIKPKQHDITFTCMPLVVLVRDFTLKLKSSDGKPMTDDDYLEDSLSLKRDTKENESHNTTRKCIREYFSPRRCFTLPHPVMDVTKCEELQNIPEDELSATFKSKSTDAINDIIDNAKQKRNKDFATRGKDFAALVQSCVQNINQGKVPSVGTVCEQIRKSTCQEAVDSGIKCYRRLMEGHMQNGIPVDEDVIEKYHKDSFSSALSTFEDKALFDKGSEYKRKWEKQLGEEKETYVQRNQLAKAKKQAVQESQRAEEEKRRADEEKKRADEEQMKRENAERGRETVITVAKAVGCAVGGIGVGAAGVAALGATGVTSMLGSMATPFANMNYPSLIQTQAIVDRTVTLNANNLVTPLFENVMSSLFKKN